MIPFILCELLIIGKFTEMVYRWYIELTRRWKVWKTGISFKKVCLDNEKFRK